MGRVWLIAMMIAGCTAESTEPGSRVDGRADARYENPTRFPDRVRTHVDNATPEEIVIDGSNYRRISSVSVIEFDEVILAPDGRSEVLGFELPDEAVGFSIVILPEGSSDYSFVYELVDPEGRVLIGPDAERRYAMDIPNTRGQQLSLNATQPSVFPYISSTPVPNTPEVEVVAGGYRLQIARELATNAGTTEQRRVAIVVKLESEQQSESSLGMMHVTLRRSDRSVLGQRWQSVQEELAATVRGYADIGIHLVIDEVGSTPPGADDERSYDPATGGPNQAFMDLMTADKTAGTINAFSVAYTNYIGYGGLATLDGGSVSFVGDEFGGLILSARALNTAAITLAHELGHHLGLYHTNIDHFDETLSYEHLFDGDQVTSTGALQPSNLMHVTPTGFELGDSQIHVIQRRPIVATYNPAE